ncbi:hypothetical protein ACQJBY_072182 [Aegilops geniculata]
MEKPEISKQAHKVEVSPNPSGFTSTTSQALRTDAGWDDFLTKVTYFCTKHKIKVVDMEGPYFPVGRPRRGLCNGPTNYHRFKVDMFVGVID